jgi:hypothetical protein
MGHECGSEVAAFVIGGFQRSDGVDKMRDQGSMIRRHRYKAA